MGLFDQFPYTNFHELNLTWILKALRELEHTIDQFVAINALKYANPIQWNITSQYEKNTIVIDPQTGTAYISVQPVPIGVALTNPDYWTVVFNLGSFVVRAAKNFANTYEADTTLTATVNTPANGWLVWGDTLYKALVNITAGDSYVVGSNIAHFTIEDVAGHLEDLDTTDKSNLVAAINELNSNLNAEALTRQNADTALTNALATETQARQDADTTLTNSLNAETQARQNADTSLTNALSAETQARQAADTALNTRVDELINNVSAFGEFNRQYHGKRIAIIGDSLSMDGGTWSDKFIEMAEQYECTVDNFSVGGWSSADMWSNKISTLTTPYDVAIVWLGINDAYRGIPVGDRSTANTYIKYMDNICAKLTELNPLCKIFALSLSWCNFTFDHTKSPFYYNAALYLMCKSRGVSFKDMSNINCVSLSNHSAIRENDPNNVHYRTDIQYTWIFDTILNKILTSTSENYTQSVRIAPLLFTPAENVSVVLARGNIDIGNEINVNLSITLSAAKAQGDVLLKLPEPLKVENPEYIIGHNISTGAFCNLIWNASGIITNQALTAGTYLIFASAPIGAGNPTFIS